MEHILCTGVADNTGIGFKNKKYRRINQHEGK